MNRHHHMLLFLAQLFSPLCVMLVGQTATETANRSQLVYVGTETRGERMGGEIYAFRLDAATGRLTPLGLAAEMSIPAFLAVHPKGTSLYAANEIGKDGVKKNGPVRAFAIDHKTGKLSFLNTGYSTSAGAVHLSMDRAGRNVLVANYSGGSVAVLPVKDDGRLGKASAFIQHKGSGPHPMRQKGPHAHAIVLSPDELFALVCDLGMDKVLIYRFDVATGSLIANPSPFAKVKPGAGPRHLTFHPTGRFVYVINELQSSVTAFAFDPRSGVLRESQTLSTLPGEFTGENAAADVHIHPTGKFVYGSNRGHDSIAVFAVDPQNGTLTSMQHVPTQGKEPRSFAIDPTGSILLAANRQSDTIVVFRIDKNTGRLTPTGQTMQIRVPICIAFVPAKI